MQGPPVSKTKRERGGLLRCGAPTGLGRVEGAEALRWAGWTAGVRGAGQAGLVG